MKNFLLGAVAALALGGSANAAELLTNGGFESPNLNTGNYTYPGVTIDSWTYTNSSLIDATGSSAWYGATPPAGQEGGQFAGLQGLGSLSQTFTASNSKAVVSWLAGGRPFFGGYDGDQTYGVSVGNILLGTYSTVSGQAFGAHSATLSGLTAGQSYTLTFQGLVAADETAFIDAVSVNGVPEPAAWALIIGGFGCVGFAGRRRRRTNTVFA